MHRTFHATSVIILLFSGLSPAAALTIIGGGNVSGSWSADTYHVQGSITVPDNSTLTVAASAVVKFDLDLQFTVNGTLDVNGTAGSEVVFTSFRDTAHGEDVTDGTPPAAGDWAGIYLDSTGSLDGRGHFDHALVRYGGDAGGTAQANVAFGTPALRARTSPTASAS